MYRRYAISEATAAHPDDCLGTAAVRIPGKRLRTEPTTQARSPPSLGAVLTSSGIVESLAGAAGL